jgi:secernin
MACHAVVALARAAVDGQTLFGQKSGTPAGQYPPLCRTPGRACAPDEKVRTQFLELPQARQTHTVLGCQPDGCWGYEYGINEHQVGMGCVTLPVTVKCDGPTLLGTDLIRLTLERSRTALQAVDHLTNLVERYGQGAFPGCPAEADCDHALLVVDPTEAYAVETAGHYWVYQEVQEVRAVSNVRVIRQDWDRISQGLASYAISQGWWADDGSKLDFVGALGEDPVKHGPALRRWGQATLQLMEQNGHIDTAFMRHLLSDQLEEISRRSGPLPAAEEGVKWFKHAAENAVQEAVASFVASLSKDPGRLAMSWCAFGAPCSSVYFPIFLDGELPQPFTHAGQLAGAENFWRRLTRLSEQIEHEPERRALVRDSFARLQARFDQEAEEFNAEGAALKQRGALADLQRQATLFMQYNLERFESVLADCLRSRSLVAVDS